MPAAPYPKRYRAKHTRSKDGCFACKTRKKKCSYEKPICEGCRKNNLSCTWPKTGASNSDTTATGDDFQGISNSQTKTAAAPADTKCLARGDTFSTCRLLPNPFSSMTLPLPLCGTSRGILEHYIHHTVTLLSTQSTDKNGFLRYVIPLSLEDDLLCHALLATSGAHLNFRDRASQDIRLMTLRHYTCALKGLHSAVGACSILSVTQQLRLCVTLAIVGLGEAIAGKDGAIFPHLKALRELVLLVRRDKNKSHTMDETSLEGFVFEVYAYLVLISNIVPYGFMEERQLPLDSIVTGLDYLQDYGSFGTFFSSGLTLFEMIAPVARFAGAVAKDKTRRSISSDPFSTYEDLSNRVTASLDESLRIKSSMQSQTGQRAVCELYYHALFIWLQTSLLHATGHHPGLLEDIQGHINAAERLILAVVMSPYCVVALWPLTIFGSSLMRKDQQAWLLNALFDPPFFAPQIDMIYRLGELLKLLWEDPDRKVLGPYGLLMTMQKHNINYCMA